MFSSISSSTLFRRFAVQSSFSALLLFSLLVGFTLGTHQSLLAQNYSQSTTSSRSSVAAASTSSTISSSTSTTTSSSSSSSSTSTFSTSTPSRSTVASTLSRASTIGELVRSDGLLRSSRPLRYKEEFYRLHYRPLLATNTDHARNIHWLQVALVAPFAPPIQALVPHENEESYLTYQILLTMHLHYLITKSWVALAARFDKHRPVYFNRPYSKDILKSLDIAEALYEKAFESWDETRKYFEEGRARLRRARGNPAVLSELAFLHQTVVRIQSREIDYGRVLTRKLQKLEQTRDYFENP